MALTYEPIATTSLSGQSTITFSAIAASWTDLRLITTFRSNNFSSWAYLRFNGDTASNYSNTYLNGSGNAAAATTGANASQTYHRLNLSGMNSSIQGMTIVDIYSYANGAYKTALFHHTYDQNGYGNVQELVGVWRSTSAITSLTILTDNQTFGAGTATLYGIKAA